MEETMELKKRFERKIMKVSEIKFDTTNPNKMSEKEQKALSESFNRFGYVDEIVIDKKTGIIADGEHRLKELVKQEIIDIEVKVFDFKDDIERRMFRQVSAKLHGTHDIDMDAAEFKQILEKIDMEDLTGLIGQSEQEILNTINHAEQGSEAQSAAEQVEKLGHLTITCPKCSHVFEKKDES